MAKGQDNHLVGWCGIRTILKQFIPNPLVFLFILILFKNCLVIGQLALNTFKFRQRQALVANKIQKLAKSQIGCGVVHYKTSMTKRNKDTQLSLLKIKSMSSAVNVMPASFKPESHKKESKILNHHLLQFVLESIGHPLTN